MNTVLQNDNGLIIPNSIQILDDVVPKTLYEKLNQIPDILGWKFGCNTSTNRNARYWHHEVGFGSKQNPDCVAEKVRQHPAKKLSDYQDWIFEQSPKGTKILRFYFNAHTFGTDGWPHTDTDRDNEQTVILYLTPKWDPGWGGETVIFNQNGDVSHAVLPRPNRIISFPSDLVHAPRPLSYAFTGLRVVLVAKLGFVTPE